MNVSISDIMNKYVGQSEKLMQLVFAIGKFYAPTVIFFDEIDSIAGKRKDNAQDYENRVKNILLT